MGDSGIYVRRQREGRWKAVDIADMGKHEVEVWVAEMSEEEAKKWVRGLVGWIHDLVVRLPSTKADG